QTEQTGGPGEAGSPRATPAGRETPTRFYWAWGLDTAAANAPGVWPDVAKRGGGAVALCFRNSRSEIDVIATYSTGVKTRPRKVLPIMPKNTAVPIAWRLAAPAPVALTSGKTPRMKASAVMRIGRKRWR